jgi:hypothetical protein
VGWFGSGSPTSQSRKPGKKVKLRSSKSKKKKRKGPKQPGSADATPQKDNGLTIPEQVARAKKRVNSVKADIAKTRQQLARLERQLIYAEKQLENAMNLPRRSASGQALAKALGAERA